MIKNIFFFGIRICGEERLEKMSYPGRKTISTEPGATLGIRHIQYTLMFAATILAYGMRTVLNVAVVAMITDKTSKYYPTYPEWKSEKNLMLSSFFWGYVCFQVGAGQLAKKYGPKLFLGCAIFIASIFTILVPLFGEKFGYGGVIACRVLQGACQGFLLPSLHNLLSAWTHITERAKWGGRVYSGQALGNVVAMPITGLVCASKYGWPLIFYIYGSFGIVWCILWIFFGSDNPARHKTISESEKKWLENENLNQSDEHKLPTPWRSIFTSLPFIAIIIAHSGENWGYWTLLTEIPSYMNEILGFDIASNSLLSALPYLVMWLLNMVMSPAADKLIDKKVLSVESSRKLFNSIAFFVPALALTALGLLSTTKHGVVITILVMAVAFNAGQYCGFMVNHIDLAPNHAGTLMAITNTTATIFSIIAPLAVDVVSAISGYKEKDQRLWNLVFFIAAGVHVVTGVVFDLLGSGEVQKWNNLDNSRIVKPLDEMNRKVLRKISATLSV